MVQVITILEYVLLGTGVLLWFFALKRGRVQRWLDAPARLPPWTISGSDFMLFALLVLVLVAMGPALAIHLFDVDVSGPANVGNTLIVGYAFQLSGLAACLLFRLHPAGVPPPSSTYLLPAVVAGLKSYVYVFPLLTAVLIASYFVLEAAGMAPRHQALIDAFRAANDPLQIALLVVLAAVVAPVTEELVFRGGLYRFLCTRLSDKWAMLISSVLFALLHQTTVTFPALLLLGCVLCGVYQKTGRLSAAIALHAVFNLNSVIAILLEIDV